MGRELPTGIEYVTVTPDDECGGYVAHGWDEYEEWSVLAGQERRVWLGAYPTVAEALADWPGAEVSEWTARKPTASMSIAPEPWFDPADAGEAWGEDDY